MKDVKHDSKHIVERLWYVLKTYPRYSVEVGRELYRKNADKGDAAWVGGYLGFLEGLGWGIGVEVLRTALTKGGGFPYDILIGMTALRAITAVYGYNLEKRDQKQRKG